MNADTFIKPTKPARVTYPRLWVTTGCPIGHLTHHDVFRWLVKLAQRGLLWHMDDDARTVLWVQGLTYDTPGARLVDAFEDPMDRRHKLCKLTKLGEKFADELAEVLG